MKKIIRTLALVLLAATVFGLIAVPASAASNTKTIAVATKNAPVRSGYYENKSVSFTVKKGTQMEVLGQKINIYGNKWILVQYRNETGWIYSENCRLYTTTVTVVGEGYTATVDLKPNLSVPYYNQSDGRWAGTYIGSRTIKDVGCLVTSCAMVYSYDRGSTTTPDKMVSKLSFQGNALIYDSFTRYGYTRRAINGKMDQALMAFIYNELVKGNPVIVGCNNNSGGEHWVVVTGYKGSTTTFSASGFTINDPGWSSRTTLKQHLDAFPNVLQIIY